MISAGGRISESASSDTWMKRRSDATAAGNAGGAVCGEV